MNSEHKFVRGDLKIADITIEGISPYPNINKNNTQNISLTSTNEISDTRVGEYTLSNTNFALSITPYYQNIQYSSSRLTLGNLLTISEQTYSLTTGNSGKTEPSTDLSMNHFCDRDSFSSFEGSNPTTNAPSNLYQISDISELGGDMSQFTPVAYADHTIKVKDSTLLFINNKFQTNTNQLYPDISSCSYQGSVTSVNASSGYTSSMAGKAYDLSGNENIEGYKWIGFEFSSNDISYDSGTATNYLNIYDKLNSYFNDGVINIVKNESNSDAIGIVNIGTKIGNLSVEFNSYSIWYNQGTENKSLESILADSNYGSLHIVSSSESNQTGDRS